VLCAKGTTDVVILNLIAATLQNKGMSEIIIYCEHIPDFSGASLFSLRSNLGQKIVTW